MQIRAISTTSSLRRTTSSASPASPGEGANQKPDSENKTSPSANTDLRTMTPNEMWDYSWKLKQGGQISDVDFAMLNSAAFPFDPSSESKDFAGYLNAIRNKPMDHIERLETDIYYAPSAEEKSRLQSLLDRIRTIAASPRIDTSV